MKQSTVVIIVDMQVDVSVIDYLTLMLVGCRSSHAASQDIDDGAESGRCQLKITDEKSRRCW